MFSRRNIYITVLIAFLSIVVLEILNNFKPKHPYAGLNTEQLIQKYEYPVEVHEVITKDGYILTLNRIPYGRNGTTHDKKTPVLFMHGLVQCDADFITLGPGKALPLLLADKGYDIWLGNVRGTTPSRRHIKLDPNKDYEFWEFTLHEVGLYDIPAFIDHIITVTKQKQLHYVGFSQGAANFFTLVSERPEYADKFKLMTALAPVVFVKDPDSPALKTIIFFRKYIETFFHIFNIQEYLAKDSLLGIYLKQICNENSMFMNLCLFHLYQLHGYSEGGLNKTSLSLVFSNNPAGVSTKHMMHAVQLMECGEFRRYDWGVDGNLKKYGQKEPPKYDLSKVTTPVALYYASNDWTINNKNIERVTKTLPNVIKSYRVPWKTFNHNDFVQGETAPEVLYNSVIEEILKY